MSVTETFALPDGGSVELRPVTDDDDQFLLALYASTREEELAQAEWAEGQKEMFLRWQFDMQRREYTARFPDARIRALLHSRDLPARPGLQTLKGSLSDRAVAEAAVRDCTHVVHLATCKETPDDVMDVTVKGLFWLLEAWRVNPAAQRFVLIGGDAAVGHFFYDHGGPVTEDTPPSPAEALLPASPTSAPPALPPPPTIALPLVPVSAPALPWPPTARASSPPAPVALPPLPACAPSLPPAGSPPLAASSNSRSAELQYSRHGSTGISKPTHLSFMAPRI